MGDEKSSLILSQFVRETIATSSFPFLPEQIDALERNNPGSIDRVIKILEKSQSDESDRNKSNDQRTYNIITRGQWMSLPALTLILFTIYILSTIGANTTATALVTAMGGLVGLYFLRGIISTRKKAPKSETLTKKKSKNSTKN